MDEISDMGRLLQEAKERGRNGERSVLATIVRTRGSTPRKVGAKMVIYEDGLLMGSIGGGCGEADVFQEALNVLEADEPRMMHVDLTADEAEESGDVCGGIMDVFIEPLRFSPIPEQ
jgi:xanthine/CO dehydrogenase XdhC/CoxF family maturation factor